MKNLIIIIFLVLFIGCAPRYNGPGNFQDFVNARYECLKENEYRATESYLKADSARLLGSSVSKVMASCSALIACLATKGYFKQQNGKFDSAGIRVNCN